MDWDKIESLLATCSIGFFFIAIVFAWLTIYKSVRWTYTALYFVLGCIAFISMWCVCSEYCLIFKSVS